MTNEHTVPKDFAWGTKAGLLAGSSLKLLLRKVGNRYFAGLTLDELYDRYDACEAVTKKVNTGQMLNRNSYSGLCNYLDSQGARDSKYTENNFPHLSEGRRQQETKRLVITLASLEEIGEYTGQLTKRLSCPQA